MKRRIAVAVIVGHEKLSQIIAERANLSGIDVVMQDEFTPCNIPDEAVVMLPPPIEPYYCFVGDDKSKNQPWKRRGKNIKC